MKSWLINMIRRPDEPAASSEHLKANPVVNLDKNGKVESLTINIKTAIAAGVLIGGILIGHVTNSVVINMRLAQIERDIATSTVDRFRRADMALWVERTARANPQWEPASIATIKRGE